MKHALVVKAKFIDSQTLRLAEPVEYEGSTVDIIITNSEEKLSKTAVSLVGFAKGKMEISSDFDNPVSDFDEYMK